MRKPRPQHAGFTLIEASLVITIGVLVFASGIAIYQQYRKSAAVAAAFDKVVALQERVETLSIGYAAVALQQTDPKLKNCPPIDLVRQDWQLRRPQDWQLSPWGGLSSAGAGTAQVVSVAGGYVSSGGSVDSVGGKVYPQDQDTGVLYYWYTAPSPVMLWGYDYAGGAASSYGSLNYIVGIVPNDRVGGSPVYYFLRGSKPATNSAGGNSAELAGQIGSGGAPDDLE